MRKRKIYRLPFTSWTILIAAAIILAGCIPVSAGSGDNALPQPATDQAPAAPTVTPPLLSLSNTVVTSSSVPGAASPEANTTATPIQSVTSPPPSPTHLSPDDWKSLPVVPTVSHTARLIYQRGLERGNDPHAFSKIGDCQSITTYFLEHFDMPGFYELGPHTSLQETIDWYSGSFERVSLAVKGGFNAAAILSPLRADPRQCRTNENPVACELRLHRPSVAFISLEEWWAGHPENYGKYLRQILDFTISQGVVPILATKADNLEGNDLINQTIADLAQEYDIPLWNFWASVQDLPNHGLALYDPFGAVDMFHLTHGDNYNFTADPGVDRSGWTMRNLTALQALDAVRRGLAEQP